MYNKQWNTYSNYSNLMSIITRESIRTPIRTPMNVRKIKINLLSLYKCLVLTKKVKKPQLL